MSPRATSRPPGPLTTTASPRWKSPSAAITPAGNRLLPFASAFSAPSSTVIVPAGLRVPAIHRLRAVRGVAEGRNQVHGAPSSMRLRGWSAEPSAITMRQPAPRAALAAASLVTMPPDP